MLFWVLTVLVLPSVLATGSFNLFISQQEVNKLLGLSNELFYVREGVPNEYALNFVVPIPAHISELHFRWQRLSSSPLPYTISVKHSKPKVMSTPKLNITSSGVVPKKLQTWRLELPCLPKIRAEVDFNITINVTVSPGNNVTTLNLRRKKICLHTANKKKGVGLAAANEGSSGEATSGDGSSGDNASVAAVSGQTKATASQHLIYVAISCSILFLVLLLGLLACYCQKYKRNKNIRAIPSYSSRASSQCSSQQSNLFIRGTSTYKSGSYASLKRFPESEHGYQPCPRSGELSDVIAKLTVSRSKVSTGYLLGEGTFSRVYCGSLREGDKEKQILIKTLSPSASSAHVSCLLQDGVSLFGHTHPNILSILGVSLADRTPPYLLYPASGTNLKRFLQQCRLSPEGLKRLMTTQEVTHMAVQLATALQYLHSRGIVHRDVSARNCWVEDQLMIRLTDSALSCDMFPADYHYWGGDSGTNLMPVKWLPPETLVHNTFSKASDIWSLGVSLWELLTLAQQPFSEVEPGNMAVYLQRGYRLAQPSCCPDQMFAIMAYCWSALPHERLTVSQLLAALQDFRTQLGNFV